MTVPTISVIVPHYDDPLSLDRCLTALMAQTGAPPFEVIVADNASPGGAARIGKVIGDRARLVTCTQRGAGPARNAGVAAARGTVLAFTDADCVPEAGWLAAGCAALAAGDIVGGAVTVLVGADRAMTGAEAFERVFAFQNRDYVERKGFSVTANLFCTRATFERVGPFRSGVSEDVDWCHRARALGLRLIYADDARVGHPARRDWGELKRKWQRMNRETFALAAGRPGGRLAWLARNVAMPATVLIHAPRVLRSTALPDVRARLAALGTLARLRLWRAADGLALLTGRH